jgi:hypothetical protein
MRELDKDNLPFYEISSRINEYTGTGGEYIVHKLDFALVIHSKTQFILIKYGNDMYEWFLRYVTPTPTNDGEKIKFVDVDGVPTATIYKEQSIENTFFRAAIKADIAVDYREVKEDWFWYNNKKE